MNKWFHHNITQIELNELWCASVEKLRILSDDNIPNIMQKLSNKKHSKQNWKDICKIFQSIKTGSACSFFF